MRNPYNREYFEKLYAESPDPWNFEASYYERKKYERTLGVLAYRRYHRVLEIGCSIGVFTAMLAPLCDELLAVDFSHRAVVSARKRLANFPHVCVERRTLPDEAPEGPFDLIVASEVLYYLTREMVLVTLRRFEGLLAPGGMLLTVHGRRQPSWLRQTVGKIRPLLLRRWILENRPLVGGDEVHELLLENTHLTNTVSLVEAKYRLDFFENK